MSVVTAVIAFLKSKDYVADVVGDRVRKHSGDLLEELPYIAIIRLKNTRNYHMEGESHLQKTRLQVNCYAASTAELDPIEKAVAKALSGYRGAFPTNEAQQGIFCDGMFLEDVNELAPPLNKTGNPVRCEATAIDVMVHHTPVPGEEEI